MTEYPAKQFQVDTFRAKTNILNALQPFVHSYDDLAAKSLLEFIIRTEFTSENDGVSEESSHKIL